MDEIDDDVQTNILNYEIAVDLLTNLSDSEILDIFGRLNSYAVTLNEQERLNANHFGPFKMLADNIGHSLYDFWTGGKILTHAQILRMGDAALAADLLISMLDGIKSKKQIKVYYGNYEKNFDYDTEAVENNFLATIGTISAMFGDYLRISEFRRIHIFYSLFTAMYHLKFGIKNLNKPRKSLTDKDYPRVFNALQGIEVIFQTEDKLALSKEERQFLEDSRRATTDAKVRVRRTEFVVDRILAAFAP